mgnify:CR=1 FL=1
MTDSPIMIMDKQGNYKSFDFSPWGGIDGFLEASKAGAVGNTSALKARVPDLLRAVDMTSSAVASLPFDIIDENENVIDSSADWLNETGGMPNPQRLLYLITSSLCGGSAYVIPTTTPKPYIYNLQYCAPQTIQPLITFEGLERFDRTSQQGKTAMYSPKQMLYFWLPDSDVEIGPALSHPLGAAAQAAGLTLTMANTINTISKRGFVPPTLLSVSGGITPTDRTSTEAWYNRWFRDPLSQIAKIINGEKMDIKQLGAGMEQLKGTYVELKREAAEDIYKAFGIPYGLVASDNAFASEFNALIRQWYSSSIFKTIYMTIEEVMTEQLFKPTFGYYWRFNPDALDAFQDDEATRSTATVQLTSAVDKSPKTARFVMDFLGYDFTEAQENQLDELVSDKEDAAARVQEQTQPNDQQPQDQTQPGNVTQTENPMDMMPGKSIVLTAPMLKDLKTWSDMAARFYRKGKGKAEDFECKALPADVADSIRAKLKSATNERDVIKAFEIGETTETKSDALILADAINEAIKNNVK